MDSLIDVLSQHLGPWWLLGIATVYFTLDKTGVVQQLFGRKSSAERLSDDNQRLIENLRGDADAQRTMRIADARWYEAEILRWRNDLDERNKQLGEALKTIASQEIGNARLRHGLSNVLQSFGNLRMQLRREGREVPPYSGLGNLLELGYEKDDLTAFN